MATVRSDCMRQADPIPPTQDVAQPLRLVAPPADFLQFGRRKLGQRAGRQRRQAGDAQAAAESEKSAADVIRRHLLVIPNSLQHLSLALLHVCPLPRTCGRRSRPGAACRESRTAAIRPAAASRKPARPAGQFPRQRSLRPPDRRSRPVENSARPPARGGEDIAPVDPRNRFVVDHGHADRRPANAGPSEHVPQPLAAAPAGPRRMLLAVMNPDRDSAAAFFVGQISNLPSFWQVGNLPHVMCGLLHAVRCSGYFSRP